MMRSCRKGLGAVAVWAAFSVGWAWASGDSSSHRSGDDPARWVDPYIGCSYNGHCFAAACVPFGMVQAGPDTGFLWWDYCSGYRYADTNILGFAQTHISGTGCGDLGDLLLMPFAGAADLTRTNFASAYRKETQVAEPGYYAVTLDDNHANVRIAAAPHAAIYEIGYEGTGAPQLFVDLQYGILNWSMKTPDGRVLACDVRQDGDRTLVGTLTTKVWVERTYSFALTFDRAITARRELPKRAATEKAPRFVLSFDLPAGGTLKAKIAKAKGYPIFLIIDEYDNFTNSLIRTTGKEPYKSITHGTGFYREWFKKFKGSVDRIFMTGVSPVTMDDLTSGFNIAANVSQDRAFNAMLGFTTDETLAIYRDFKGVGEYRDGDPEAILKSIKPWYDGYIVELKYSKPTASDAEIAAKAEEGFSQLRRYAADPFVPELAKGTRLHLILYQFQGTELIRLEEIAP